VVAPEAVTTRSTRDRYLLSSLMEEAITSSQMEGAATTRDVAKAMIRSRRPPRDGSERMTLPMRASAEQRSVPRDGGGIGAATSGGVAHGGPAPAATSSPVIDA
jgi:hypothetical protein